MSDDQNNPKAMSEPKPNGQAEASFAPCPGSALACQMERISREGMCGKTATHKWHTKQGYLLVCDDCLMGIYLCGGNLTPIAAPNTDYTLGD